MVIEMAVAIQALIQLLAFYFNLKYYFWCDHMGKFSKWIFLKFREINEILANKSLSFKWAYSTEV